MSAVQFALGPCKSGIPLTAGMQQQLQTAMQGGSGTQTFIQDQNVVNNFYAWIGELGSAAWIPDRDDLGNPVYFAEQQSGANTLTMIISAALDRNVIDGDTDAPQFTVNDGNYSTVGVLAATQSYNGSPIWTLTVPIGVATMIPKAFLKSYASSVLTVLMDGFMNGINRCFQSAQSVANGDDIQDAAEQGAEEAAVDGAEVEGASVSLAVGAAAMAGFVVLTVVPVLLNVFAHQTFHCLQVYNLTPYDVVWSVAYQNEGTLVSAPLTGAGSTDYDYALPALTSAAGGAIPIVSSAVLGFSSTNELTGVGYVLSASFYTAGTTDRVGSFMGLFDIPFTGDNSLAIQQDASVDGAHWYSENAGQFKTTQAVRRDAVILATSTFDFLDGQHPAPNGQNMYWYNSVLAFQPSVPGAPPEQTTEGSGSCVTTS